MARPGRESLLLNSRGGGAREQKWRLQISWESSLGRVGCRECWACELSAECLAETFEGQLPPCLMRTPQEFSKDCFILVFGRSWWCHNPRLKIAGIIRLEASACPEMLITLPGIHRGISSPNPKLPKQAPLALYRWSHRRPAQAAGFVESAEQGLQFRSLPS